MRPRPLVVGGAAAALVVAAATVGLAAGRPATANGTPASPPSAAPPAKTLTVTGGAVPLLAPGAGARDLGVRVANPARTTGAVTLRTVTASVASNSNPACVVRVDPAPHDRGAADIVITTYDSALPGAPRITLERDGQPREVPLTIEMWNRDANQDPCKGVRLALTYTATASGL